MTADGVPDTRTRPRVPRRLRPGSRVAVVAPSGVIDPERLADGCGILRGWGLEVELAPHLLDRHGELGYLAGPDSARAKDLEQELGFGHCSPQLTVPLGVRATLDAGAGTLTVPVLPEPG